MDLLKDVVLKGVPMAFPEYVTTVEGEERSSILSLRGDSPWRVPPGLKAKVAENGRLLPFFGDTVILPVGDQAAALLEDLQRRLHSQFGGLLADPLPPESFHVTLHDLNNGSDEAVVSAAMDKSAEACAAAMRDLANALDDSPASAGVELRSGFCFPCVNTSIVLGLLPCTDRDYRIIMNAYNRFDEVVYLSYWLRMHVTLAYLRPRALTVEERNRLRDFLSGLDFNMRCALNLRELQYCRFRDMSAYTQAMGSVRCR